jgi:copper chaperone CopZ
MTCGACVATVERIIRMHAAVRAVSVALITERAAVRHEQKMSLPCCMFKRWMPKFQHEDICYLLSCCAAQIELMTPESFNIEDNEDAYRARMEHIVAEIVEDVNDCGYESTILSVGRCYVLSVAYFGFSSLLYLPFVW